MEMPLHHRRSSFLPMQLCGVEIRSFLPNRESDAGNLSCQGETRHRRSHPFLKKSNIEIVQGARVTASGDRSPFEEILHIGIMVVTQATHGHALPVSLQFPSDIAVLTAVVGLQRETTVSPQLTLGTETVWRLQLRNQQGRTNRTDRRNLAKQFHGMMLAALGQQIASRLLTHRLQQIQLLIEPFGPETNSGFRDLA